MMDLVKAKAGNNSNKKGLMIKTWERCKPFGGSSKNHNIINTSSMWSGIPRAKLVRKSKSWPRLNSAPQPEEDDKLGGGGRGKKGRIAPEGCFSVYVGPQRQRFVIKTEYVNHPLFKDLLEEAESEYGYHCQGPLALPCNVDIFLHVLMQMDSDHDRRIFQRGCKFTTTATTAYRLL